MHSSSDGHRWGRVAGAAVSPGRSRLHGALRRSIVLTSFGLFLVGWSLGTSWDDGAGAASIEDEVIPAAMADLEAGLGPSVHLPMEVNERVEYWMRRYLENPTAFEDVLSRAGAYTRMIGEKLAERDMPQELVYLAMIESEFHTGARSRMEATGMWQMMSPTARAYGLRIDGYVDERRDPVRATDAALEYLATLQERYGSWYLAAAAYNAGPTRVSRALRRHAGGRIGEEALYWEIVDHLPRETADFVPKLLAAAQLAHQAERYGLKVVPARAFAFDTVWVPGGTLLTDVAERLGIPAGGMRNLNPQLIRGVTPPENAFALRVPTGRANDVVVSLSPRVARLADD
jgi:peptidoglycan lytic transglycosylase D